MGHAVAVAEPHVGDEPFAVLLGDDLIHPSVPLLPEMLRVVENTGKNYLVEVTLHEGRKHIVRRMLAEAGFPVDKLVRVAFGPITLGDQKSGWLRRLSNTEVGMLMKEVDL